MSGIAHVRLRGLVFVAKFYLSNDHLFAYLWLLCIRVFLDVCESVFCV